MARVVSRMTVAALRQQLAAAAVPAGGPGARSADVVRLRIPDIDGCFPAGGLPVGAVHELWASCERHRPAAMGFALALARYLAATRQSGDVVWVYPRGQAQEWGLPYAPGLMAFGHDPGRFILVEAGNALEALWAGEETLRASAPSGVIVALDAGYQRHAFMATRRLELAARTGTAYGLLLCTGADPPVSAASLRWRIEPSSITSSATGRATGRATDRTTGRPAPFPARPHWRVALERNRFGRTGTWNLEWDHESQIFIQPATVPGAVATPLAGRTGSGDIHRLRRAGA